MKVSIRLRGKHKYGDRELLIPILPEKIGFKYGGAAFVSCEIMGLGEVAVPTGTELSSYAWESIFPGSGRQNDLLIFGPWLPPSWYDSTLEDWKKEGTLVNLMITGYPINVDVYVKSYQGEACGAFGDIAYALELIEARTITLETSKVENTTQRAAQVSRTYTIKSGDTLWGIAKKFYNDGSKWTLIYKANKEIIEMTAKKRGRSSSENGHWIYPGVTLIIPDAGNSTAATKATTTQTTTPSPSTKAYNEAYTDKRNESVESSLKKYGNQKVANALADQGTKF